MRIHSATGRALLALALLAAPGAAGAAADPGEIGYPAGSLGYDALKSADYRTAELQLRTSAVSSDDPALLINLGQVYARTDRSAEAAALFARVIAAEEVELVLASGRVIGSRAAARRALRSLKAVHASR